MSRESSIDEDDVTMTELSTDEDYTQYPSQEFTRLVDKLRRSGHVDLSMDCVWQTSSTKTPHNVYNLIDGDSATYWQSDAEQPHLITVSLAASHVVTHIAMHLDYTLDTNYTPEIVTVRTALAPYLFSDVAELQLTEPVGWQLVDLTKEETMDGARGRWVRHVQFLISENHHGGKDCHVRQVVIIGRPVG